MNILRNRLFGLGSWFATDPQRVVVLIAVLTVLTILCITLVTANLFDPVDFMLIAENSPGGSG